MIPSEKKPLGFNTFSGDGTTTDGTNENIVRSALHGGVTAASSDRVNRTHRVVRERAKTMAARRSKIRSLWLPLTIFSILLVGFCIAVWTVLDEYELVAVGSQVSSYQVLVPLIWSIPVSAALLAVIWFRQSRGSATENAMKGPVE